MRPVGTEARKAYARRLASGFFDRYLSGKHILDIGYRGGDAMAVPVVSQAIGVDLDYPGYDGTILPFADLSQDALFVSHCLEHIHDYQATLKDWYRVLKIGGYLLVFVPHKYLYERRLAPPSAMNPDHKRFYTPCSLLAEIGQSLPVNGFRIRHLADNDYAYDYDQPIDRHPEGCYEIELVVEKIKRPPYSDRLEFCPAQRSAFASFDQYVQELIVALHRGGAQSQNLRLPLGSFGYFPPFADLKAAFARADREYSPTSITAGELERVLRMILPHVEVDSEWYLRAYPDVGAAVAAGAVESAEQHFLENGYFEGRLPRDYFGVAPTSVDVKAG